MSKVMHRTVSLNRGHLDEEARTVEVAFSSEEPVERGFGKEILDHDPSSVRLGRLNGGAAVLVDHDSSRHVGVVEKARIDKDRRGRAILRFGSGAFASEVFNDIRDGIRRNVSVGYVLHDEPKAKDGDEVRFRDWEPFEISIVAVPADASVGVGRSKTEDKDMSEEKKDDVAVAKEPKQEERKGEEAPKKREAPQVDVKAATEKSLREERERVKQIRAIADEHDMDELGRQFIDEGREVAEFQRAVLDEIGKQNTAARVERAKRDPNASDDLDIPKSDLKDYRLFRAMNAMCTLASPDLSHQVKSRATKDAGLEIAVSEAAADKWGVKQRGILIPMEVMNAINQRDLNVSDDSALVGTDHLGSEFIDVLRNSTAVLQAGARVMQGLTGDVDIPRKATASSATWVSAEDGQATESEPTFNTLSLSPKDLAVFTEATRRLLQQSNPSVEALIRDDINQAIALGIDSAAHYGSGVSGQPAGIAATSGINTVTFAATQPTYAETVNMVTQVKIDNADAMRSAFITDSNGWDGWMTTEKATNTGLFVWDTSSPSNPVIGRRAFVSNQITQGDYFYGDYSQLILGFWSGLDLTVDPFTNSLRGRVRFILFQTMDIGVRHATAFVRGNSGSTP